MQGDGGVVQALVCLPTFRPLVSLFLQHRGGLAALALQGGVEVGGDALLLGRLVGEQLLAGVL